MTWRELAAQIAALPEDQKDLTVVCLHDGSEEYETVSFLTDDSEDDEITPVAYLIFEEQQEEPYLNALWFREATGITPGTTFWKTPCHFNAVDCTVSDIEPAALDGLAPQREWVLLANGKTLVSDDLNKFEYANS